MTVARRNRHQLAGGGITRERATRVTVLWGTVVWNDHGKYLAVYNHTTGDLNKFDSAIDELSVPPFTTALLIGYIVGFLGIACFYLSSDLFCSPP